MDGSGKDGVDGADEAEEVARWMNVEVEEVVGNGCMSHGRAVGRVRICKRSEHKICSGGHGAEKKREKNEKKRSTCCGAALE